MKTEGKVESIAYTLTRRRASKSITVRVDEAGHVQVSAPFFVPKAQVEAVITSHRITLLAQMARREARRHTYASGDRFLYEGRMLTLAVIEAEKDRVRIQNDVLIVTTDDHIRVKSLIKEHYRRRVRERVATLMPECATQMGVVVPPFAIRDSKKRWASCSSKGRLSFSLRCQCLTDRQLHYLIIHELAHLIHFDHSPAFYTLLARHVADYRAIQGSIFSVQQESQLV